MCRVGSGGNRAYGVATRHRPGAVAADDVRAHGGVLDEARVNRLRYLEGTPKGSTRWIDTGWALVVVAASGRSP